MKDGHSQVVLSSLLLQTQGLDTYLRAPSSGLFDSVVEKDRKLAH